MNKFKRICPKCGASYDGGAFDDLTKQKCSRCGSDMETSDKGVGTRDSSSSSTKSAYKAVPNHRKKYGGGSTLIN
jgi:transcription initiation factor IIE alpha subunit